MLSTKRSLGRPSSRRRRPIDQASAGSRAGVTTDGGGLLSDSPPDARGIGITRQRLNQKFGGDLRGITSVYYWLGRTSRS
jgi:hypothetical protein